MKSEKAKADTIIDHHDGHGLADRLVITCDDRDPQAGNASHTYTVTLDGEEVALVQFQHGARTEAGSTPGALDSVLAAILLDRYRGFQSGPFACRENALVITKIEEALHWMKHRADDRARRRVLGKNVL